MYNVCRYLSVAILLVCVTPIFCQQQSAKTKESRNGVTKAVVPITSEHTNLVDWLNNRLENFNFPDQEAYNQVYNRLIELENGEYIPSIPQGGNIEFNDFQPSGTIKSTKSSIGLALRPENLIAEYEFDEGQGNAINDLSGNGNTAFIREYDNSGNQRGLTLNYWNTSGVQGSAIEMDGIEHTSNSIIEIPTSSTLASLTDQITVMAWVNRDIGSIVPQNGAVSNVGILTHDYPSFFFGYHNTLYKLEFFTDTGGVVSCYTPQDTLGEWNHIAGTYDGSVARLYVNGQQICSENLSGNLMINTQNGPLGAFTISGFYDVRPAPVVPYGNASGVTDELDGRIDKFKLYNAALTVSELQAIYNEELAYLQGTSIPVTGITISPTTLNLVEGDLAGLSGLVTPSNATNPSVYWSSANNGIATVDSSGLVTAVSEGTTSITATTNDGGYSASATVTVTKPFISVTGISLDPTALDLLEGEAAGLSATVSPSDATDPGIVWTSGDNGIATVDSSGLVTAVSEGTTSITATTNDGGYSASATVTVTKPFISVTGISLDPTSLDLLEGEAAGLSATVSPSDATDPGIVWTSGDNGIATVDSSGLVTAVSEGTTSITATTNDGGYSASATVTVTKPFISVTGISLDPTSLDLLEGEAAGLSATVSPSDATDPGIVWTSGDNGIATVDSSGLVTAVSEGTTSITATTNDGGYSASATVTVTKPFISVTGISLDPTALDLLEGETSGLSPTVSPSDATDPGIVWTSGDNGIATVDSSGLVTAVSEGTTSITATTNDGGYSASATVTVTKPFISVTGISLDPTSLDLLEGEAAGLSATVSPSDATDPGIVWTSGDNGIATVDSSGLVTAVSEGTTSITATTNDGGYSASATVTVTKPFISVTGISLDPTSLDLLEGEAAGLSATVSPSDATDPGIVWTSGDNGIATVDSSGLVTAVSEGTTSITATTNDGGYSASATVTVTKPFISVKGISLDPTALDLLEGEAAGLSATVSPSDATDPGIVWTSGDNGIATVDSSGLVTAVSEGTTSITATTNDGGYSASATVTVTKPIISVESVELNPGELELIEGETFVLSAVVVPNNASNNSVLWTSENPEVATVDKNGKVEAISDGQTNITIESVDGGHTAVTQVTIFGNVPQSIALQSIQINPKNVSVEIGGKVRLMPSFIPLNATNKTLNWQTNNPLIAMVDNSGEIIAISGGSTTIKATSLDGGFTSEATINVIAPNNRNEDSPRLVIAPNPASDLLEISMRDYEDGTMAISRISFFQMNGKEVMAFNGRFTDLSKANLELDISSLARGSYLVTFFTQRHGIISKWLVIE